MRLTKLGIGIIAALLVINAVSLSYIVANQRTQYLPFTITRIDYLRLVMNDYKTDYTTKYDLDLRSILLIPGNNDADIKMLLNWDEDARIGEMQDAIRDAFIKLLEAYLLRMYQLNAWEANPVITCVHKRGETEVDRVIKHVSTTGLTKVER